MATASRAKRSPQGPASDGDGGHRWRRAATLDELDATGSKTVALDGRTIVLWRSDGHVYALDNRCPHMGFPLDRGSCRDGILTCHWHAARFDLATGGTFDQFAGDVEVFSVELRGDEVWVDTAPHGDARAYHARRLREGLEQDIRLVIAKSSIALLADGGDAREPLRAGLEFGVRARMEGWAQGLTMLTCFANLLPALDAEDRPRALFAGLDAVSRDTAGHAPRFMLTPLPGAAPDVPTLKRWFRQFCAVRDEEAAERALLTAIAAGATPAELADLLFAAATDYRYLSIGHVADFINKALEALDFAGWEPERTALALSSLVRGIAQGNRQEESNAWRYPIDLVALVESAIAELPAALAEGAPHRGTWESRTSLAWRLLEDDPRANIEALLGALGEGATPEQLAGAVAYAAALRIARFHTSNEFGDWDTTLHTFSFANAVHAGLRRLAQVDGGARGRTPYAPTHVDDGDGANGLAPDLLRGVFDAAMSVYLDRFLNVPAAPLPPIAPKPGDPRSILRELLPLLDRQQQVNEAGELVARYLAAGGDDARLMAALGTALLREDRDFHTIQTVEAAFAQYRLLRGTPAAANALVAAARYLAAHAPTARAQGQTYSIALRLHRGERLFEG
ncbi:MAG TPA: Rieske (2Fe-2S) protein [Ktedonobacterales bacterium]